MNLQNPIWVSGPINDELMFVEFTRRLSEVLEVTKPGDTMTVLINSSGGESRTGLGLYDLIMACDRHTVGIVVGRAESAASMILQACRRRIMTARSTMMLHKSTISIKGSVENAQSAVDMFRTIDERYFEIYAKRSVKSSQRIAEMAHRDLHFSAEEALAEGLIDEVLSPQ